MLNIVNFINLTFGSETFLLFSKFLSFLCKFYLILTLLAYTLKNKSTKYLTILLSVFLVGAILSDMNWAILIIKRIFCLESKSKIITFISRMEWAFFITQYQALALFLIYLIEKKITFKKYYWVMISVNVIISFCFLYLAFFKFHIPSDSSKTLYFETKLVQALFIILFFILGPALFKTVKSIKNKEIPKILRHQLKTFLIFLIIPHIALELITHKLFFFSFLTNLWPFSKNTLISFSAILCSYAIYYCSKNIIGLRFLNAKNHVQTKEKFDFINDFKDIIEQLSYVTSAKELSHITKIFFKAAFEVSAIKTTLYIEKLETKENNTDIYQKTNNTNINSTNIKVENFFIKHNNNTDLVNNLLRSTKLFIKDEIEFSNFYEEKQLRTEVIEFLDNINADVFLPIYERQNMIAYIIVEQDSRNDLLYNSTERDEMLVFTSYLSNIINILKHSNLDSILKNEKELKEELYNKHQEVNQHKESIRSFLRNNKERKIGIVFYKGRRFTLANQAAHDLIGIDINLNQGHSLTQAFKQIAKQVQEYKSSQIVFARDNKANKIILNALPSLEHNNIIILVYYPEISDIIKPNIDSLKNPTKWDHLLHLETTKSGQLINNLIPGKGENLTDFKVSLLSMALTKQATLLEIPENDLIPTVEILHHISLREHLHIIKLNQEEKNFEVAIKLFGLNPLLDSNKSSTSLLEKLDETGTIFIQNIHFLDLETQNYLADFIAYGFFNKFKSDHKTFSNIRIICSSDKNLQNLTTQGLFSQQLFNELKKTSISLPSLTSLTDTEVTELAQGFTDQIIANQSCKNLLDLNEKDKIKILNQKPVSLQELKEKVHQLVIAKSNKQQIYESTEFDPAYNIADPELAQAARLGKKALKNQHIMTMLWDKFKNQNKIASLLGVNRSSINRRCKEYNLTK